MTEIGTERVEPTSRLPDRLNNEPRREPRSRPRRQPQAPDDSNSEAADNPESSEHQVDSLA
jgi:hypothetical protein